jgi:uncharacterized protein YdaU (DUF1376 family)
MSAGKTAKSPAFRFYPSDFMGSPDVQSMDLCEVGAYIYLLSTAWLAERHGYLPDDDERLRRWARMTREQWAQSRALLLSKFPVAEEGWRSNPRMVKEADKQELFSASQRKKAGKRWGSAESMPGHDTLDARAMPSVSAFVSEVKKKQKPSRAKAASDPRHGPFKQACETYATHKKVQFAWDGSEAKALASLLAASPGLTLETFRECLNHRARSDVPHGERPRKYLPAILSYQEGPLDEYGKPKGVGNGKFASKTEASLSAAQRAIDIIDQRGRARREAEAGRLAFGEAGDPATGEIVGRGLPGDG